MRAACAAVLRASPFTTECGTHDQGVILELLLSIAAAALSAQSWGSPVRCVWLLVCNVGGDGTTREVPDLNMFVGPFLQRFSLSVHSAEGIFTIA